MKMQTKSDPTIFFCKPIHEILLEKPTEIGRQPHLKAKANRNGHIYLYNLAFNTLLRLQIEFIFHQRLDTCAIFINR